MFNRVVEVPGAHRLQKKHLYIAKRYLKKNADPIHVCRVCISAFQEKTPTWPFGVVAECSILDICLVCYWIFSFKNTRLRAAEWFACVCFWCVHRDACASYILITPRRLPHYVSRRAVMDSLCLSSWPPDNPVSHTGSLLHRAQKLPL